MTWPVLLLQVGWNAGDTWLEGASSVTLAGARRRRPVWTSVAAGTTVLAIEFVVVAAAAAAVELFWPRFATTILTLLVLMIIGGAALQLTTLNARRARAVRRRVKTLHLAGHGHVVRVHSLVNSRPGDGSAGVLWQRLTSQNWPPGTVLIAAPASTPLELLYRRSGAVGVDGEPLLAEWRVGGAG